MPEPHRIRVTSPADMVAVLPYLIGFTPEDSLVVVALSGAQVAVTARVDLADVAPPRQLEGLLDKMWERFPGAQAVIAAYTPEPLAGWAMVTRAENYLGSNHVVLSMLVAGDTWYARGGESGRVSHDGDAVEQAVASGLGRLANRAELERALQWAPDSAELSWRMLTAIAAVPPDGAAAIVEALAPHLAAETPALSEKDALQLAALLGNTDAKTAAVMSVTSETAAAHQAVWEQVVRATPASAAEAPLFLAGLSGWVGGDGARAAVAAEHAREITNGHLSADTMGLEHVIDAVIPPTAWEGMRADMLLDASPAARSAAIRLSGDTPVWETVNADGSSTARHPAGPAPRSTPETPPGIAI